MKQTFKLVLLILLVTTFLTGCIENPIEKLLLKRRILNEFEAKHGEEFWFIRDLCYSPPYALGDRGYYRGMIYSESLRELDFPLGISVYSTGRNGSVLGSSYENVIEAYKFNKEIEPKLREIFGSRANVDTSSLGAWDFEEYKEDIVQNRLKGEEKKIHLNTFVTNVFIDNLDEMDIKEYREKTLKFAKYLYDELDLKVNLFVNVRDDRYLNDYEIIKKNIFPDFIEKKEIKGILELVENNEELSEAEKQLLIENFWKRSSNDSVRERFWINFSRRDLNLENIINRRFEGESEDE